MGFLEMIGLRTRTKKKGEVTSGSIEQIISALKGERVTIESLATKNTSWVWYCATKNADSVASVTVRLFALGNTRRFKTRALSRPEIRRRAVTHPIFKALGKTEEVVEIVDHPALELIGKPSEWTDEGELWFQTQQFQEIFGNSYWILDRDPLGRPLVLTMAPAQDVKIRTENQGRTLIGYEWQQVIYTPEKVVQFKIPSVRDPWTGMGPLESCFDSNELRDAVVRYLRATFKNMARPDHLIRVASGTPKKVKQDFFRQYRNQHSGDGAGKPLVVEGEEVKIEQLSFPPKDMGTQLIGQMTRDEILSAFGVPLTKVQISKSRAEAEAGNYSYAYDTIRPRVLRRDQTLNSRFVPIFDDSGRLFFASDNPVPEDEVQQTDLASKRLIVFLTSVNEERAAIGMEPVPWGNVPLSNVMTMPLASDAGETDDTTDDEEEVPDEPEPKKTVPPVTKSYRMTTGERKLAKVVESFYRSIERDVMARVETGKAFKAAVDWWDAEKHAKKLREDAYPIVTGFVREGAKAGEESIGALVSLDINNPQVEQFVQQYTFKFAEKISTTLNDDLRRIVSEGLEAGDPGIMKQQIKDLFDTTPSRAEMIARTESARATTTGYKELLKENPLTMSVVWHSQGDCCDWCAEMNGTEIGVEDVFFREGDSMSLSSESGGRSMTFGYGDVEGPPLHPNCRCDIQAVIPDERKLKEIEESEAAKELLGSALETESEPGDDSFTKDKADAMKRLETLLGRTPAATFTNAVDVWTSPSISEDRFEKMATGKTKAGKTLNRVAAAGTTNMKTLYRGIAVESKEILEGMMSGLKVGDRISSDRLVSASWKSSVGMAQAKTGKKGILLKIGKEGGGAVPGVHVSSISNRPKDGEVLVPKGNYRISEIKRKRDIVEIDVKMSPRPKKAEEHDNDLVMFLLRDRIDMATITGDDYGDPGSGNHQ